MRRLLLLGGVVLLVWASVVVPIPLAVAAPVSATPLAEVVEVDGPGVDHLDERFRFTAVRLEEPTVAGAVATLFDQQRTFSPLPTITAPGAEEDTFARFQEALFVESLTVAVAGALDRAGEQVTVSGGGARVLEVLPVGAAADELEREDVITALDGEPVELASDLATRLDAVDAGTEVEVTYERDGQEDTTRLPVAPTDELADEVASLAIGVFATTVDLELTAPVDVEVTAPQGLGGPSAGLLLALAAYDAATEEDLAGDRIVAGSGTIDVQGRVGRVDGIPQKVQGAVEAGAEVFLVPAVAGGDAARAAADGALEVIEVEDLDGAIDALGTDA